MTNVWKRKIEQHVINEKTKIIVIGCKMDLEKEKRVVSTEKAKEFCLENRDRFVYGGECSAKSGKGVEEVMVLAIDKFLEKFPKCHRCELPVKW